MKQFAALVISLLLWAFSFAQKPNVSIINPTSYSLSDSVLSIHTLVGSTYAISTVTASVNGRSSVLTRDNVYYDGTLSLSGLNEDTLTLKVVVIDVMNNSDSVETRFIYDKLPLLFLTAPLDNSVARPTIFVKAGCANKDTCTMELIAIAGNSDTIFYGTFIDSVNTTVDLSRAEGKMVSMSFRITDERGYKNYTFGCDVFVESSPYLTKVFDGNSLILDFNYKKVFMAGLNGAYSNNPLFEHPLNIVDILTHDSVSISDAMARGVTQGSLTPFGAMLQSYNGTIPDQVLDWNSGNLTQVAGGSGIQTAGNYAIFEGNFTAGGILKSGLGLRDLATQSNILINPPQLTSFSNEVVSPNGYVAYSGGNGYNQNVYTYKNGNTQAITNDQTYGISDLVLSADTGNILYYQQNIFDNSYILHLYDGHKDTVLADVDPTSFNGLKGMYPIAQVSNNSFVFPKKDNDQTPQLWLRDSLGNYAAITSYGTINGKVPDLQLDLMNPSGDFIFFKNNWLSPYAPTVRRYIRKGSLQQEICSGFGRSYLCKTYYRDSSWYIAIGRELFRINLNIDPDKVISSVISDKKDSVYTFSTAGFVENYTGSGQLINLMINNLPVNGKLLFNGQQVTANQVIARSDLGKLSYLPNAGFTGVDSFAWNGSNGINYTPATAYVRIDVTTISAPPQPLLSVIQTSYCGNLGDQKVKIDNLPAAGSGTSTQVKLDATVLTIAADSSFLFNVNDLTAGTHTISVIYSNTAGADTTTESFTITAPVTPVVKLTASDTVFATASQVITITAANTAGGGANPQYTFASDRGFLNVLQQKSSNNTLSLQATVLPLGYNWIYTKMTTSAACYSTETGLDSIRILRDVTSGLNDPDFPSQTVNVFPNPFSHQLTIDGLQPAKTYSVTLTDMTGRVIYAHRIAGKGQWQSDYLQVPKGVYGLRLYDETKHRVLGVITILRSVE
jgi:hypothetical protein